MAYRDLKALQYLAEDFAKSLAEVSLPPGELSVIMTLDKDWSGDREVSVIFQDRPRPLCKVRRRDPNPIEGHKLATLPFMKSKRRD